MNQLQQNHHQASSNKQTVLIVIIVLGAMFSGIIFSLVSNSELQQQKFHFEEESKESALHLQHKLSEYLTELNSIKRLYNTTSVFNRKKFYNFVAPALQKYSGIQALEWVPKITNDNRPQFMQQADPANKNGFKIRERNADNRLVPAAQRQAYFPVLYAEPLQKNQNVIGFDLASDEHSLKALYTARDSGLPVTSSSAELVRDQLHRPAFQIMIPVYQEELLSSSVKLRRNSLSGFIIGVFRTDHVIQNAIPELDPTQVILHILDKSVPDMPQLTYSNVLESQFQSKKVINQHNPAVGKGSFYFDTSISIAGLKWQLIFNSGPQYNALYPHWKAWLSLTLCLLITFWLSFYIHQNQQRTAVINALVEHRTAELQNSESHNQAILSTMFEGLILCNRSGTIEAFNPAAERLYGYSADEVIGQDINILVPDKYLDKYGTAFHDYLQTGKSDVIQVTNEFRNKCKDGSIIAIEYSIGTMQETDETKYIITVHDISDRKQAEARLAKQAREAKLLHQGTTIAAETTSFIEALQNCIDMVCNIMEWPAGIVYVPDEANQAVIPADIWHWDDFTKHELLYESINNTPLQRGEGLAGKIWHTGTSLWIKDIDKNPGFTHLHNIDKSIKSAVGFPIYVDYSIVAIMGFYTHHSLEPDFDLLRVLQILGEQVGRVFEKRRAEKAITDAEERARLILESTGEGIYGVDLNGKAIFINPAAEQMIGYSADELIGKVMHRFIHHSHTDGTPCALEESPIHQVFKQGKVQRINIEAIWRKDGTQFPAEYTVTPMIKGDSIVGAVITFRDITERLKIDQMKSEFIATVSHELRTPLTSIRGSLGLLAGGVAGELPEKAMSMVDIANKNSERLLLLINDILDLEKLQLGKMSFNFKETELTHILEQSIESSQGYARDYGVTFRIIGKPEQATVNIDTSRFLQVMSNLLSNAAKFSPTNGFVDISIEHISAERFSTEDGEEQGGTKIVRISVTDRGPGIPKAFQDKIFGKFCQADSSDSRQKGGTGLGLNISKSLIEKMNGVVGFITAEGKGTTFYIDLPEVTGTAQQTPQRRQI